MTVDVGAGDCRYALRVAAKDPGHLIVAVDADRAGLAAGYSRARRQRLDNVLFVVAAAPDLPPELDGLADEVRIQFPWGSLLRAVLDIDAAFAGGLGALLKPGGRLVACLSLTARDAVTGYGSFDAAAARGLLARLERHGPFAHGGVVEVTPALAKTLYSTWANRLRVGHDRRAWLIETVRESPNLPARPLSGD